MIELTAHISVETLGPGTVVLHIQGRLYMGTLQTLEEQFEALIPKCANKKVVADLSETTYVSSNCWSVFLINARRLKTLNGILLFAGMKGEVLNAYELLELRLFIQSFPDVSTALAPAPLGSSTQIRA